MQILEAIAGLNCGYARLLNKGSPLLLGLWFILPDLHDQQGVPLGVRNKTFFDGPGWAKLSFHTPGMAASSPLLKQSFRRKDRDPWPESI